MHVYITCIYLCTYVCTCVRTCTLYVYCMYMHVYMMYICMYVCDSEKTWTQGILLNSNQSKQAWTVSVVLTSWDTHCNKGNVYIIMYVIGIMSNVYNMYVHMYAYMYMYMYMSVYVCKWAKGDTLFNGCYRSFRHMWGLTHSLNIRTYTYTGT